MKLATILLSCGMATTLGAADDLVIADFEGDTYGAWTVEGTAFGTGPAKGTLPNQKHVDGFLGKRLVNSFAGGDASTGRLVSPPFTIQRHFLAFLIGGGMHPGETGINLLVDGKAVRSATGPASTGDDAEELNWESWDVAEFAGRSATIEIIDRATGGWGHINVDHILQSDFQHQAEQPAARTLVIDKRYLHLPVKNGAHKRTVTMEVGGAVEREFVIELAPGEPDFWAFYDVSTLAGKSVTLHVQRLPPESQGLAAITSSDGIRDADDLYRERLRPQFHFSSRRGWINDPNGLVFQDGEYHLYYQHNPFGTAWENMHWGHAVSRDLVHWQELSDALWRRHAFSGSAAIDHANTGGFQTGSEPALVAAWTDTVRGECIAFSNDRGRTFSEYPGNPVVRHHGRDPRIFWYAPDKHWVMALYDEYQGKQWITIHTSPDLKQWTFRSRIEGFFECPDLYELPVDGKTGDTRWVLTAANGHYVLGRFDGATFTPDQPGKVVFPAAGNLYAAQTWNDIPASDGRRLHIGWFRTDLPGMAFNQSMTFPSELTLRTTADGIRLCANPAREIATLHQAVRMVSATMVAPGEDPLAGLSGELLDVRGTFTVPAEASLTVTVRGVAVTFDAAKHQLSCLGKSVPCAPSGGRLDLRVLVDRASIEIYADGGLVYLPLATLVKADERSLHLSAQGGTVAIAGLEVAELASAWPTAAH